MLRHKVELKDVNSALCITNNYTVIVYLVELLWFADSIQQEVLLHQWKSLEINKDTSWK